MSAGDGKLGFAIVGTGMIAGFHARAIAAVPGAQLRAVSNLTVERARAFAAKFGGEGMSTLTALLARADVDVVCVTTPSGNHGEVAIAALRAGKHVFCEKPLEITPARIDAMIAAAERAGRVLAPVFQYRFGAGAQQLKRALAAQRFGRLALCSAYVKWWRDPGYYRTSNWKGTTALDGGGVLMNQAIHAIDLLQWLAGMPVRVSGRVATRAHAIEVEDTASAWLEFPGGALGVIEAATSCYPGTSLRLEFSGEKGTAILENDRLVKWEFAVQQPEDEAVRRGGDSRIGGGAADPKAISVEGHRALVADLVDAIKHGRPTAIPAREARNAVAIIHAIYQSSQTAQPIALNAV